MISCTSISPDIRLRKRGANVFRWGPVSKFHIHQRSAIEIDSVLRAAFHYQTDQPAAVSTRDKPMNGHFLPRKSKFVALKISIELYRPAF